MKPQQEKIEELLKQLAEVETEMRPLFDKKAKIQEQLLACKSPFKVGDKIQWGFDGARKVGVVEKIIPWVADDPQWIVHRILKDGSSGVSVKVRNYNNPTLMQ